MSQTTETLQTLKINKLVSQDQYNKALSEGRIENSEFYLVPEPVLEGRNSIIITEEPDKITFSVANGDINQPGIVQLSNTASDTEEAKAATPKGVQEAITTAIETLSVSEPTANGTSNTFIATAKQENGKIVVTKANLPDFNEENIKLKSDLYTYTPIGKITGATNKNPVKVANKDSTLKSVFNAVFGIQQDEQPTIGSASLAVSQTGSTSVTGGEFGKAHSTISATVTFTLTDSVTCSYGYRIGDTKTTGLQTVKYPITKQSNADIKITLPSGQTASSSMVTVGSYVSHSSNVLYCNFNSSKQVTISFTVPDGNTQTSAQTRYDKIKGEVILGNAQTTTGTSITKFLTMQNNDASVGLSGGNKSNSSTAYTITAGYVPYTYQLATSTPSSLPTANRTQNKPTSITVSGGSSSTYLYIFVPSSKSDITSLTASGFDVPFSKIESSKSYVVNDSQSATYKVFKTTDSVKGDTFKL